MDTRRNKAASTKKRKDYGVLEKISRPVCASCPWFHVFCSSSLGYIPAQGGGGGRSSAKNFFSPVPFEVVVQSSLL